MINLNLIVAIEVEDRLLEASEASFLKRDGKDKEVIPYLKSNGFRLKIYSKSSFTIRGVNSFKDFCDDFNFGQLPSDNYILVDINIDDEILKQQIQ